MKTKNRHTNTHQQLKQSMLVLVLLCISVSTWAQPSQTQPPTLDWNAKLNKFLVDNDKFIGQRFTFRCPERTVRDKDAKLFGTHNYPSDNPICVAAVHAGVVTTQGGVVQLQLNPGTQDYVGSTHHGVTSNSLPKTQRSIVFIKPSDNQAADAIHRQYVPRVDWNTKFTRTGLAYHKLVGQQFTFKCPNLSGNPRTQIYGTDQYAFNSLICLTAVHAGQLTKQGGMVTLRIEEGIGQLTGSIRNGVESKNGPGGSRTIRVIPPTALTTSQASL